MSVVILLVVPTSGAKSSCLAYDGVHDRVNIGKPRKLDEVDFTDALKLIRPTASGGCHRRVLGHVGS